MFVALFYNRKGRFAMLLYEWITKLSVRMDVWMRTLFHMFAFEKLVHAIGHLFHKLLHMWDGNDNAVSFHHRWWLFPYIKMQLLGVP